MKDKMPTRDDSGFEALFMPLQEILSKVWEITLTKCLEKYLNHLKLVDNPSSTNFINFTEAAVLVQNSATFYCKRVDSVYLGCRKFVERLQQTYVSVYGEVALKTKAPKGKGDEVDENGIPNKKRRIQKNLANDNADVLDFVCSENNIEMKPGDIDKNVDKKRLILNKNLKSFLKNSTSISVYQTKEVEMGTKDEFKLNWPLSIVGVLNEDFVINKEGTYLVWGVNFDDSIMDVSFDMLMGNDLDVSNNVEFPLSPNDNPGFTSSPMPASPLPISSPEPVAPKPPALPVATVPLLKNLQFDFFIPLILAKKKKTFVLPVNIIHEVENWRSSRRKRKFSSDEDKENLSRCNEKFKEFFNFLKHYELQDPHVPQFKINNANNERRKELLLRRKENAKIVRRAAEEFHDDFPGFDDICEDNDDNNDHDQGGEIENPCNDFSPSVDVGLIRPITLNSQDELKSTYEQDAILTMKEYQRNKRQHANELTEVAKRVAAWHDSMHEMLEAAETRSKFDIHKYGSKILDSFPNESVNSRVSFHQLVRGQPKPEISRFLLSTLMLANTYNVELVLTESGPLVKDCLQLKLLSKVRHHEEMDEHLKATTSHEPLYQ